MEFLLLLYAKYTKHLLTMSPFLLLFKLIDKNRKCERERERRERKEEKKQRERERTRKREELFTHVRERFCPHR